MFEYKNDLLVVDELIYDPSYPTKIVVRINRDYFMIDIAETKKRPIENILPYKKPVDNSWRRGNLNWQFWINGLIPRSGFKVSVGRAITPEEFEEIIKKYGLTEDEISEEFNEVLGSIYGKEYAETIRSVQIKVPDHEAISLETELKEKGIQAGNTSPGRVNIRTGWGGRREGAGRPSTGRKKKNYYVTDEEDIKIRELLETLRKSNIEQN